MPLHNISIDLMSEINEKNHQITPSFLRIVHSYRVDIKTNKTVLRRQSFCSKLALTV